MPEVSLATWNNFLEDRPDAHFLQTGAWGELKSRFGWQASRLIVGDSGAQILFRRVPFGFTVAYMPKAHGATNTSAGVEQFWVEVDALCRSRRAILCKYEADAWMAGDAPAFPGDRSVVPSPHSVQPRRTIIVDLDPAEVDMLARMRQKCRYNIRLAEKKGVTVRSWTDVPAFHAMLVTTGKRDAFPVHSTAYYQHAYQLFHAAGMCELLVAEYEGLPLAAIMVFCRGHRAWYVYGGSTDRERERMPNYLLQWEAMRWAKGRGCSEYDLWGVPDVDESALEAGFDRRQDGLWGVYRFKRGFGGELRRAAQALDHVYSPLPYRLYRMRMSAQDEQ